MQINCRKYAKRLNRKHQGYGYTFFIDEVFVKINGKQHYLWRAFDQDGEVVDVYLQARRDGAAAKRFFRRLLRSVESPFVGVITADSPKKIGRFVLIPVAKTTFAQIQKGIALGLGEHPAIASIS